MRQNLLALAFAILGIASISTSHAAKSSDQQIKLKQLMANFKEKCGNDVQKFCSNTPSGQGRLWSCLDQHESDLSQSCKNFQVKLEQRVDEYLS